MPYAIHRRINEAGAMGFVTARVMESVFIAVGLTCMLAISTLRQDAPAGLDAALGQGLERSTSGASGSGRASSSASATA